MEEVRLTDRVDPGGWNDEPPFLLSILLFLWDGIEWSVQVEGLPRIDLSLTGTTGVEFRFGKGNGFAFGYSAENALRGLAAIIDFVL